MNKADFIYGIARIRSKELSILKKTDIDSLITANTYSDAERILSDKGWRLSSSADTADICEIHLGDVWNFIKEFTPDEKFFYSLVIEN
ncbi:MAG: V-type ATPase subunit, partial [Clostridiales bacterium]|nr:V-type ATPase subunit [Clostridiales bacterium]